MIESPFDRSRNETVGNVSARPQPLFGTLKYRFQFRIEPITSDSAFEHGATETFFHFFAHRFSMPEKPRYEIDILENGRSWSTTKHANNGIDVLCGAFSQTFQKNVYYQVVIGNGGRAKDLGTHHLSLP